MTLNRFKLSSKATRATREVRRGGRIPTGGSIGLMEPKLFVVLHVLLM